MEFSLIRPDKLKVSLSREELDMLGIALEKPDYSADSTRQALISLLEQGRMQTGFSPRRAKLYIETCPHEDGGCIIYYTRLAVGEAFVSGEGWATPNAVVFAFPDTESLVSACAKALRQYGHRIYKSSLFSMGSGYRLVVQPLDYTDRLSVDFLREYGDLMGEGAVIASFTEEHGNLLCRDEALETLARFGN